MFSPGGVFRLALVLLLPSATTFTAAAPGKLPSGPDPQNATQYLVILSTSRNFPALRQQAVRIGRRSHLPFTMLGQIYDRHRGLILPDNSPDEIWAGRYCPRRFNQEGSSNSRLLQYLSIEKSTAYPGLKPGFYIIVGGIYDTPSQARQAAQRYHPLATDAYVQKTKIYLGCIH